MARAAQTAAAAGAFLFLSASAIALPSRDEANRYSEYADGESSDQTWLVDDRSGCGAYDYNAGPGDSIRWSGDCRDGRAEGEGTLTLFSHGRVIERLAGRFSEGSLEDGDVRISWSDGSRYEGGQKDGAFEGYGVLVAADRKRYDGIWQDDRFKGSRDVAAENAAPAPVATPSRAPKGQPMPTDTPSTERTKRFDFLPANAELVAADGGTLFLSETSGVLTRTMKRADGSGGTITMSLLSEKIGTVNNDKGEIVATFHLRDKALAIDYDDGHTEDIAAQADGSLLTSEQAPGGAALKMAWYPPGHIFPAAKAPVQSVQAAPHKAARLAKRGASPARASLPSVKRTARLAAATTPTPHSRRHRTAPAQAATRMPIAVATPPASPAARAPLIHVEPFAPLPPMQPVMVRTSEVHPIDITQPADSSAERKSASECLTVESNGTHWGFRNTCVTDIQFAYCVKNGGDRLTACGDSAVPGSVPGHGFSALIADLSLKEENASHAFRWVGCIGGAGEVVPRLDQSDPPMGRCLHASDLPAGTEHADARR